MQSESHPPGEIPRESLLCQPSAEAVQALHELDGDLMILGAGGKMGPTLTKMAVDASRAAGVSRRVIAVSRFSNATLPRWLQAAGAEPIACDLLDPASLSVLPAAENIIFMAGMKFGASASPARTWAMNCCVPANVCRHFRDSRIVAFSSGNVYPMVTVDSGGSRESDAPQPIGEYAMSVLGRERIFQYFSESLSIPVAILRLNYATELHYGVLVDLAKQIAAEQPIDVTMSHVNVIWQGDANAMTLAALRHTATPAQIINLAGAEILRIRDVATRMAKMMGKPVQFTGIEGDVAFLNNGANNYHRLGLPQITADQMIRWTVQWVSQGGPSLDKPTHFQTRNGQF